MLAALCGRVNGRFTPVLCVADVLSGRALFTYDPSLFVDDDGAVDDDAYAAHEEGDEDDDAAPAAGGTLPIPAVSFDSARLAGAPLTRFLARLPLLMYHGVFKFWTHWTTFYCFCDRSVHEKAWRSRKRVAQATRAPHPAYRWRQAS